MAGNLFWMLEYAGSCWRKTEPGGGALSLVPERVVAGVYGEFSLIDCPLLFNRLSKSRSFCRKALKSSEVGVEVGAE
jgi:hypothetical protein